MMHLRTSRLAKIVSILALAFALVSTVAGCGSKSTSATQKPAATPTGATAKAGLAAATSALATTAPDAKLLVVQTANAVTPTATAVWSYLFGSPKTDKTYLVYVKNGKAEPAAEYGKAGLSKTEWPLVPGPDVWKIDSDAAYQKAQAASGAKASGAYTMGFISHVPKAEKTSTTKALVWYVSFDKASGASTDTVEVDAQTGAIVAK